MRTLLIGALGTMLVASAAAPGAAPQTARSTSGPVLALAADGNRASFIVAGRFKCISVMIWEPVRRRAVRLQAARTCETSDRGGARSGPPGVGLAGTRAAWLKVGGGITLETYVRTATLGRPSPADVAMGVAHGGFGGLYGTFARSPVGDGTLLALTIEERCYSFDDGDPPRRYQCPPGHRTGDIVQATIWRVGGLGGRCPLAPRTEPTRCSVVAKADSELSVLAVDAGRIAARTVTGLRLLTADGRVLRDLPVKALDARLSGNRLAVRTASTVEVYDTGTRELVAQFPVASGSRLQDLHRGILVTAQGETVRLRRLGTSRTTTLRVGGTALADLESSGLFTAGARSVKFMPMRDVLRRLGG